jgi:hypothetical protein
MAKIAFPYLGEALEDPHFDTNKIFGIAQE